MKNFIRYFCFAAAIASIVFAGCKKDKPEEPSGGQLEVKFTTDIQPASKLKVANDQFETNDQIGVFMKRTGQALTASGAVYSEGDNVLLDVQGAAVLAPNPPLMYPLTGNVDFIAYYPYTTPLGSGYTLPVDVSVQSPALPDETLYSNNAGNKAPSPDPVALNFNYSLAKLEITVQGGDNSELSAADFAGMTVDMEGLYTQANLQLTNGAFVAHSQKQAVALHKTSATETSATFEALVLPRTATDGNVTFLFHAAGKTYKYTHTPAYEAAKLYGLVFSLDFPAVPEPTAVLFSLSITPRTVYTQNIPVVIYVPKPEDGGFSGGAGTSNDPYLIGTAEQLDLVRDFPDSHFELTNDIHLCDYLANGGAGYAKWGDEGWMPIGNFCDNNPFAGTFNGNGYKITCLWINRGDFCDGLGLFGYVSGGNISNLGVEISEAGVIGHWGVGGLVGYIENFFTSSDTHSSIKNCYVTGNVVSKAQGYYDSCVGGLVGFSDEQTSIENCYATGNVSGSKNKVGGLVGYNDFDNPIKNCYATGNVTGNDMVGGLVGQNRWGGPITDCYATGNVTGNDEVGGLAGHDMGPIRNCYASGNVVGIEAVGGLAGYVYHYYEEGGTIINCVAANSFVSGTTVNTNRILGYNDFGISGGGNLSNNYAHANMTINGSKVNGTLQDKNGSDISPATLKTQAFYTAAFNWNGVQGWNFSVIWKISEGVSYPYFQWQGN